MGKTEPQSKLMIELNHPERFTLLEDGWIKDRFTDLDIGPSSDKRMTFKQAEKYAKEQGGRLPEVHELHSLVDFSKRNPANFDVFKDTKTDDWYWTATKVAGVSWNGYWCVSFYRGIVDDCLVDYGVCVRPVRASQ